MNQVTQEIESGIKEMELQVQKKNMKLFADVSKQIDEVGARLKTRPDTAEVNNLI